MKSLELTKTKMMQGVWQGLITGAKDVRPTLDVTHLEAAVQGITLEHNAEADHWQLTVPIPAEAIADGVQTILIKDRVTGEKLGHISLLAGEALGDDIRAEMDLLRAELDMLKRAFRRHCLESD